MSPQELYATRRSLCMEASEAAEVLGKCSKRHWYHMEQGNRTIPDRVIATCQCVLEDRDKALRGMQASSSKHYRLYRKYSDWLEDYPFQSKRQWKVYQSALIRHYIESDIQLSA